MTELSLRELKTCSTIIVETQKDTLGTKLTTHCTLHYYPAESITQCKKIKTFDNSKFCYTEEIKSTHIFCKGNKNLREIWRHASSHKTKCLTSMFLFSGTILQQSSLYKQSLHINSNTHKHTQTYTHTFTHVQLYYYKILQGAYLQHGWQLHFFKWTQYKCHQQ